MREKDKWLNVPGTLHVKKQEGTGVYSDVLETPLRKGKKKSMENAAIALDSTVRSQDSNNSKNSKDSKDSKDSNTSDSKPESCLESKHSKEILISEKQQRQQPRTVTSTEDRQKLKNKESKDESTILMFTSCGQLLLGTFVFLKIFCNFIFFYYFYYFISNVFCFVLNFISFFFLSLIKIHFVRICLYK